jgi:two-component system response regulator NreC
LVDDHQLFRQGLRTILAKEGDLTVVGEASDAREAYQLVVDAHPDVVVLDVSLPGVNGIAATRELVRREPHAHVLMLSMHSSEDYVAQALAAGATGYALKDQSAGEVVDAIRAVARGQAYLSPKISRFVVEDYLRLRRGDTARTGPLAALSVREQEIFDLLVRGFSNDGIAGQLCISVKTVETHRAHILHKLHLHSIAELVRFAARHNLVAD